MAEELKKIIDEQKALIISLNEKLAICEGTKSHFISNIRNEIINPFASIHGLAKFIIQSKKEEWKKVISIASLIHKESFMLDFQLMNIFSAAELESGELGLNFYKSNLNELIISEINNYNTFAKKRKIQIILNLQFDSDMLVVTDLSKIKIIFVNLLMNAINFSKDESKINVECIVDSKNIHLSVTDYGEGLSEDSKQLIFERFSKANSEINSINSGLGIGLSVVAGYIELFNGELKLESEKNKGSKFMVNIPIPDIQTNGLDMAQSENEIFFEDELF